MCVDWIISITLYQGDTGLEETPWQPFIWPYAHVGWSAQILLQFWISTHNTQPQLTYSGVETALQIWGKEEMKRKSQRNGTEGPTGAQRCFPRWNRDEGTSFRSLVGSKGKPYLYSHIRQGLGEISPPPHPAKHEDYRAKHGNFQCKIYDTIAAH